MEPLDEKPWDQMTDQERVEWHRLLGKDVTSEELRAYVEGVATTPDGLAVLEKALARLKAQQGAGAHAPDGAGNPPTN